MNGVVNRLSQQDALSVGELSTRLGVSHASISQIREGLDRAGLIAWDSDSRNVRLRRLRLSAKGQALVLRLTPLWAALNAAATELNEEAEDGLAAIDRLERAVGRRSIYDRVSERMG